MILLNMDKPERCIMCPLRQSCMACDKNLWSNHIPDDCPIIEQKPVKFIPINADCRGYADIFGCTNCGGVITVSSVEKELDYDFCPWCGGKA